MQYRPGPSANSIKFAWIGQTWELRIEEDTHKDSQTSDVGVCARDFSKNDVISQIPCEEMGAQESDSCHETVLNEQQLCSSRQRNDPGRYERDTRKHLRHYELSVNQQIRVYTSNILYLCCNGKTSVERCRSHVAGAASFVCSRKKLSRQVVTLCHEFKLVQSSRAWLRQSEDAWIDEERAHRWRKWWQVDQMDVKNPESEPSEQCVEDG